MSEITYTIILHEEDTPVKGNAMASGDDAVDRAAEQAIIEQLEAGNPWAWCSVEVRAEWEGFRGSDWLGCCSYGSEEEFRQNGYFEDMKGEAKADLERAIDAAVQRGEFAKSYPWR